jgi:hypothetical protein
VLILDLVLGTACSPTPHSTSTTSNFCYLYWIYTHRSLAQFLDGLSPADGLCRSLLVAILTGLNRVFPCSGTTSVHAADFTSRIPMEVQGHDMASVELPTRSVTALIQATM